MKILTEENPQTIDVAIAELRAGKIISFNCDTVYGLAVDANNSKAVEALYKLKNRDAKKPLAIFLPDLNAAKKIFHFSEIAQKIATDLLPGNLTLVLPVKDEARALLENLNPNSAEKTLGLRIVNRPFISNLLQKFGTPLAVTSANFSGEKDALNASEVASYFNNDALALLIDGKEAPQKIASTVAKISGEKIEILRLGSIAKTTLKNYERSA